MNKERIGNFSSSKIYMLASNGKSKDSIGAPFYTYINEKVIETRLGKQIENEHAAKPTTWGTFVEQFAFRKLSFHNKLESKSRDCHPTIKRWTGAKDYTSKEVVGDIKCPWTLKSFCELVELMESAEDIVECLKKNKKEYYWQLVSNSIITGKEFAQLVLFVPYESELQDIQDQVALYDGDDSYKYYWLVNANHEELPSLIEGGYYKNFYQWTFEIPKEDKQFLTERVIKANYEMDKILKNGK